MWGQNPNGWFYGQASHLGGNYYRPLHPQNAHGLCPSTAIPRGTWVRPIPPQAPPEPSEPLLDPPPPPPPDSLPCNSSASKSETEARASITPTSALPSPPLPVLSSSDERDPRLKKRRLTNQPEADTNQEKQEFINSASNFLKEIEALKKRHSEEMADQSRLHQAEISALKQNLWEEKKRDLEQKNKQMAKMKAYYKEKDKEWSDKCLELKTTLDEVRRRKRLVEAQLTAKTANAGNTSAIDSTAMDTEAVKEEQLQDCLEKIAQLESELRAKTEELERCRTENFEAERERMEKVFDEQTTELRKKRVEHVERYREKLKQVSTEADILRSENTERQAKVEDLQTQLDLYKDRITQLEGTVVDRDSTISSQRSTISQLGSALKEHKQFVRSEIEQFTKRFEALEMQRLSDLHLSSDENPNEEVSRK